MAEFSEEEKKILSKHVSNLDENIYLIFNLPPEVRAVLFAYVSRSPASFRENLLKLLKGKELQLNDFLAQYSSEGMNYSQANETAQKFHEKWVVGYGHSSVAEHAVASIAFEDVSILASKVIEDARLASYTEKSTRYQVFDKNRYYKPKELKDFPLYEKTCNNLFDLYCELTPKMLSYIKEKYPQQKDEPDGFYEGISKARACDELRYILPASTLTNLAMTANARVLEHTISRFLSNPLTEMQEIGSDLKKEVTKVIPVLVKFANPNPYFSNTDKKMPALVSDKIPSEEPKKEKDVELVDYDKEAEDKLITSILYRYSHHSFAQLFAKTKTLSREEKEKILEEFLNGRSEFDSPLRELEHVYYTFDLLMDYGAFRDVQRHRMCTQTNQPVTTKHGYSLPSELAEAGFESDFSNAMKQASEAFEELAKTNPLAAQYVVPLAFKKRTLFTWNLRELFWFIRLRARKEGHLSYRKIAWHVFDELEKVHPFIAKYIEHERSEGPARGEK